MDTSLHLLIAKWGVMRVSLMIAYHSFAHSLQVLVPKVGRQEWVTLPEDIGTLDLIVPEAELAARPQAGPDLTNNDFGMGRELFTGFRRLVNGPAEGASVVY